MLLSDIVCVYICKVHAGCVKHLGCVIAILQLDSKQGRVVLSRWVVHHHKYRFIVSQVLRALSHRLVLASHAIRKAVELDTCGSVQVSDQLRGVGDVVDGLSVPEKFVIVVSYVLFGSA